MLRKIEAKVIEGGQVTREEAFFLSSMDGARTLEFLSAAYRVRRRFRGDAMDLCSIVNAKSGSCSEDCAYCAQSSRSSAGIAQYPLISKDAVIAKAREAKEGGSRRFCIVTSGRKPSVQELEEIAGMVAAVRESGLLPCATLGLLSGDELSMLAAAGLERFHNNLETSERFFPEICSTHNYQDKVRTLQAAKSAGLSVCSGGIFGLGETWEDRIDLAFAFREIGPESVPLNFLTPIEGTRLASRPFVAPAEALRIISLYRFILPDREIRVCGGRMQTLGEMNSLLFLAGADGLLIGNYLTTLGRRYEDDLRLIGEFGLTTR